MNLTARKWLIWAGWIGVGLGLIGGFWFYFSGEKIGLAVLFGVVVALWPPLLVGAAYAETTSMRRWSVENEKLYEPIFGNGSLLFTVKGYSFVSYSAIMTAIFLIDPAAVVGWLRITAPLAEWLAQYVPVLRTVGRVYWFDLSSHLFIIGVLTTVSVLVIVISRASSMSSSFWWEARSIIRETDLWPRWRLLIYAVFLVFFTGWLASGLRFDKGPPAASAFVLVTCFFLIQMSILQLGVLLAAERRGRVS
jgi:hypothetical protein